MNTVEDRLRAALRETAGEVTPQSVPPLRLHGARRRRGMAGTAARRRWAAWLAPLAAAASVTAVVAASLAISTAFHGGHRAARGPAGPFAGVPPYYVVLAGKNPSPVACSGSSPRSGRPRPARCWPGHPAQALRHVQRGRRAGDGRTFVLVAAQWKVRTGDGGTFTEATATKFFLLHLGAGGHIRQLTPLPIPRQPGGAFEIALSPDGSKLAVALRDASVGGPAIQVFNLATGSKRVWTWPGGGPITNNAGGNGEVLSWAADGRDARVPAVGGERSSTSGCWTPPLPAAACGRTAGWPCSGRTTRKPCTYVHGKISNVIVGFSAIITGDGRKIVAATGRT